ncbi:MAG TPA: DUF4199 domain-containing protein, partial [Mucilaginibacter sp.]|nr:DUF4199 domain-containing protein [Mucilaginibacter sp.]
SNSTKVATKWALINVLTGIVLMYVFQFANVGIISPVRYVSYLPFIAFLFLAQKEFKDQLGGYMKFGEGFGVGLRYGIFSGLLLGVFIWLYYSMLSPDMYTKMLEAQREAMEAKGMSADQVDQGMKFMNKMGLVFVAFGAAVGSAVVAIILGLIGAAIFKKERSAFDQEPPADPAV